MKLVHCCKLYVHTCCCKWKTIKTKCALRWEKKRGRYTLIAKERKRNHAIHQYCLPVICGVYLRSREKKKELCLLILSAGFPSTHLTELRMESKKQRQFKRTTELAQPAAPDRFLVILPGPQRLIHILKNCRITQTTNRSVRFDTVKWITTSKSELCKAFYPMLRLAIRKVFTALWQKNN